MIRIYTILFTLALPLFTLTSFVLAQNGALVLDPSADYTFGEELRFSFKAQNASGVENLTLFFRPELSPNIYQVNVPFQPGETISVTQAIDITNIDIRPFSNVNYFWEYETAGGTQKIPDQIITYEDDNYAWQKMTRDDLTVHWVGEPPPFGQSILDIVDNSLFDLTEIVPLQEIEPIDIYVYPNMMELREALSQNELDNFQTSQLDLGVILLATANSQMAEIELPLSVPYELAHLLLYRAAGERFSTLPWWFREGTARSVQPADNPQHDQLLLEAIERGTTIPFLELCNEPEGAGVRRDLAALQSASFVRYLIERQSTRVLPDLLSAFISGSNCEQGIEKVLDTSLGALEQEWLASIQEPSPLVGFINDAVIWIIILLAGTFLTLFLIGAMRKKE
jgi:hypothetical protein